MQERTTTWQQKMRRLASGARPRVMDLFSGCGGLSLGFQRAEFEIVANVELDRHAAETHARNFHQGDARHASPRDITAVEPEDLLNELDGTNEPAGMIDVIVGGPPCQAYTRVGRAKLRDVHQHPEAFRQDPRGNLYLRYLQYVEKLQPLALVMENVPDSLSYGGVNIPHEVANSLSDMGYECRYTLLNAVHYGVPQLRERMILIAIARVLGREPEFPPPTRDMPLPEGYRQMRQSLLPQDFGQINLFEANYYVPAPSPDPDRPKWVTARQALEDLPAMKGRQQKVNNPYGADVPYPESTALSDYAQDMRTWPGFKAAEVVTDHVTRAQPRDYPIFQRMAWGHQYPDAHRIAGELLTARIAALGRQAERGAPWYEELKKEVVPPYDPLKFPNKWRKIDPEQPARTLLAHLGKDTYTHIHYDHDQARTISVREAARLQSFPDGFKFPRTLNAAYKMIGNAVPPLLSFRIAEALKETLRLGVSSCLHQPGDTQQSVSNTTAVGL